MISGRMTSLSDAALTYCPRWGHGVLGREGPQVWFVTSYFEEIELDPNGIGCYVDHVASEVWLVFFAIHERVWVPFLANPPDHEVLPPGKLREILDERNRIVEG